VVGAVYLKDMYLFLLKIEIDPSEVQILLEVVSRHSVSSPPSHCQQSDLKNSAVTPKVGRGQEGVARVPQEEGEGSSLELVAY
jgi:hypothetical protein